jgi:glucosamine-6-phosphate deaminase
MTVRPYRGLRVDGLEIRIHEDISSLARAAACDTAEAIAATVSAKGAAKVMFATGNSQLAFVAALTEEAEDVPWGKVEVFHMDEYVGIGPDHPASFQRWIRERISDKVNPLAAHYIDGSSDPCGQVEAYSKLLSDGIDLCCLGIGENGHLAFNDPPVADFEDHADLKVVELDQSCRMQQVNEGHFPDLRSVPKQAITVTIPALLRATRVIAVVPEARKARPVRDAIQGPISPRCPASALRTVDNVVLHLDSDSGSLLSM